MNGKHPQNFVYTEKEKYFFLEYSCRKRVGKGGRLSVDWQPSILRHNVAENHLKNSWFPRLLSICPLLSNRKSRNWPLVKTFQSVSHKVFFYIGHVSVILQCASHDNQACTHDENICFQSAVFSKIHLWMQIEKSKKNISGKKLGNSNYMEIGCNLLHDRKHNFPAVSF